MLAPFTPYDIAQIYERQGDNERRIWKLLAYAGRYGKQPLSVTRQMTMRELRMLSAQLADMVEEENAPAKNQNYR